MSLLDDVSIVITPNGYKARTLFGAIPVPTEGSDLVTGANSATTVAGTYTDVQTNYGGAIGDVLKVTFTLGGDYRLKISSWFNYFSINSDIEYNSGVNVAYIRVTGNNYGSGDLRFNNLQTSTVGGSISDITVKVYVSADMDVTRATAATRVDEAGLVNYAEILGSEEVTNGYFTQTPLGTGWTVTDTDADNYVVFDGSTARLKFLNTSPVTEFKTTDVILTGGKTYKLIVDVAVTSGRVKIDGNGISEVFGYTSGVNTRIIQPTSNATLSFYRATSNVDLTFNSVSVKEVTRDNVPRIDYSGGGCPHILAEPQRTNLITYSSDFSSGWTGAATLNSNSSISPDGTLNASNLLRVSSSSERKDFNVTVLANTEYVYSFYIKEGSQNNGDSRMAISTSVEQILYLTPTSDWVRYELLIPSTNTNTSVIVRIYPSNGAAGGVDGDNINIYGAQLEEGSYATSYIPTDGSTVTRVQDQFTRDGIGSLINSTEGVLFVEMAALSDDGTNRSISVSDGTTGNRITIRYRPTSGQIQALVVSGSTTQAIITKSGLTITDFTKIALKYKVNDFALWIDGLEVGTDISVSAPIGMNSLGLDSGISGNNTFYGKVKQLQVYKTALTDTQLAALTS